MKIIQKHEYKSIKEFENIELPDFTVLTGMNGSGKTQLCEAISGNFLDIEGVPNTEIMYHNYLSFNASNLSNRIEPQQIISEQKSAFTIYQQFKKEAVSRPGDTESLLNSKLNSKKSLKFSIDYILSKTGKKIIELTESDFLNYFFPEDLSIFSKLGRIFKDHYTKFKDNNYIYFEASESGADPQEWGWINPDEFTKRYGEKPWELVNQILDEFENFNYKISTPEGSRRDESFCLEFFDKDNPDQKIKGDELSSGEKTLIALIVSLYSLRSKQTFPKVLLLDEIDASLHPSMTQKTLEILAKIFVGEKKMKVLITTHSPSTIAFAPEESIYVMCRTKGEERIKKETKEKALEILTEGFMTMGEGLNFINSSVASEEKIIVVSEGKNWKHLEKAWKMLEIDIPIDFQNGKSSTELKTLYDYFLKHPVKDKIYFFVWDCDCNVYRGLSDGAEVKTFVFDENDKNQFIISGIENLYDENLLKDGDGSWNNRFISKRTQAGKIFYDKLNNTGKNEVTKFFCEERNEKTDFKNFEPLFKVIQDSINK